MTNEELLGLLRGKKPVNIILDTDAYNEIDDQYCIAYCMLCPDKINLLSINAAPFFNSNSKSPADGMEKSYNEIFKIMHLTDPNANIPVYRGSTDYLGSKTEPQVTDAAKNIVDTVMNSEEPVVIVAIGAITNVASALIMCPEIAKKSAVIWLGGHALHFAHNREFNLRQDVFGAQVLFDSNIPLLQLPCNGVVSELVTTVPEMDYYLKGKNELSDYLCSRLVGEAIDPKTGVVRPAYGRIIWDITAAAVITHPEAFDMVVIPRPIVTDNCYYAIDNARAPYIYCRRIDRRIVYADVFGKIANKDQK